jgi:Na+/phosphate symporter
MTATVALILVLVVGLVLYLVTQNKASEVGRILFFCALLALCLTAAPSAVHWLR